MNYSEVFTMNENTTDGEVLDRIYEIVQDQRYDATEKLRLVTLSLEHAKEVAMKTYEVYVKRIEWGATEVEADSPEDAKAKAYDAVYIDGIVKWGWTEEVFWLPEEEEPTLEGKNNANNDS